MMKSLDIAMKEDQICRLANDWPEDVCKRLCENIGIVLGNNNILFKETCDWLCIDWHFAHDMIPYSIASEQNDGRKDKFKALLMQVIRWWGKPFDFERAAIDLDLTGQDVKDNEEQYSQMEKLSKEDACNAWLAIVL